MARLVTEDERNGLGLIIEGLSSSSSDQSAFGLPPVQAVQGLDPVCVMFPNCGLVGLYAARWFTFAVLPDALLFDAWLPDAAVPVVAELVVLSLLDMSFFNQLDVR